MYTLYFNLTPQCLLVYLICHMEQMTSFAVQSYLVFILSGLAVQVWLGAVLNQGLRKDTFHYENTPIQIYMENFTIKIWNFLDKKSIFFHISAQNIDCGYSLEPPRRGGSNEYPQSMFLSRNKKNNVYPCKPQFYYIKVGFKGVKII